MKTQIFIATIILIALAGCASTGDVVLRSDPSQADVYVVDIKTGQSATLGKTPLTFSKKIPEGKNSEILQLRVEKEGFEPKYTSVATFGAETAFVDLTLSSVLDTKTNVRKAFEENRRLLTDANRLAAGKRFSEALTRVEKILESDPRNDEALAAKGSIQFLMKDYEGALASWKKSLEINPSNDEVRAAVVDLNLSLKAKKRSPANTEGN